MNTCQHSILGIMRINRYKLRVQFQTQADANSLVTDPILALNNYIAYLPFFLTTKTGIIRNYPTDLEGEGLLNPEFCRSQFKIIKAKRMKIFVKVNDKEHDTPVLAPTNSVKIIFQSQPLPTYLVIHSVFTDVIPFIPKPIIRQSCCRYGHRAPFCKGKNRCSACGLPHDLKDCENANSPKCILCKEGHLSTNFSKCSEFITQKKLRNL